MLETLQTNEMEGRTMLQDVLGFIFYHVGRWARANFIWSDDDGSEDDYYHRQW